MCIGIDRVNSKATLRVPFSSLLPLVPRILHQELRSCRYATERTDSLVIQSDESRKQSSNVESCFEKLHNLLETTAKAVIPGETSEEQKERVKKLYVHVPCNVIVWCHGMYLTTSKPKSRKRSQTQT